MLQVSDIEMIFGFSQRLNSGPFEQAVICGRFSDSAQRLPAVGQVCWLVPLRQVGINILVWGQESRKACCYLLLQNEGLIR